MFKNIFTTNWHPDQKKFEDSDSSNSNRPKAKKSVIKSVTEMNFPGPPDRENGKDSWGFLDQKQPFLGCRKPAIPKRPLINLADDWSEKTNLLILIRRDGF